MTTSSEITVVIPAHNRSELLLRAVKSVLAQNLSPKQIVVVDDGSPKPLVESLPKNLLSQIILIRNDQRKNAAYSRNRAVQHALSLSDTPGWLAFLDSDDIWQPDHLECALQMLRTSVSESLYITPLSPETKKTSIDNFEGVESIIEDSYDYLFGLVGDYRTSGFVCSRAVFDSVGGFDEQLEKHQDWDFALRASKVASLIVGEKPTLYLDTRATGRMSAKPNLQASEYFLKKHAASMRSEHIQVFFGGVLRAAAEAGSVKEVKKRMAHQVQPDQLDRVARVIWHCPKLSEGLFFCRQRWRRQPKCE